MTTPTTFDRKAFLRQLWSTDAKLARLGFPAISPWWRAEIERFVRSGTRRWVIRAGRRAGKSSTLSRFAVCWALFGAWSVPPGDTAIVPFVSVNKDESAARLRTIAEVLRALGLAFEQRGDELELISPRRVVFRTVAATTRATVGFTSIACFGDEVARYESRDSAANPAQEVFASLFPTLATQPHAFAVLCSSPWGADDYHAELFDAGDSLQQRVSFAATWTANPTITEAGTHDLEHDPRVWAREYAAEPGVTLSAALDAQDVAACFRQTTAGNAQTGFLAIDASSLRGDAFAWIAGYTTTAGHVAVYEMGAWSGDAQRDVTLADIAVSLASKAREFGVTMIFGDQREEAGLRPLLASRGMALRSFAWSDVSKDSAVMTLRRLMRERRLAINESGPTLRREMLSLKARLMPSGRVKYLSNGLDFVSCLITLCHAIDAHALSIAGGGGNGGTPMWTCPGGWGYGSGGIGGAGSDGAPF